jgi:quercetin dioxygenase-like cupin family protein
VALVGLAACAQEGEESAIDQAATAAGQRYPNLPADVVFLNERVVAQRIISEPGNWAGGHAHTQSQLAVVLKGGTITYREGDEETPVTYEDGDVFWVEPTEAHDHATTSESTFEVVLITIAEIEPGSGARQAYPDMPADVVFENERVVAQRISVEPGQWAGEHAHTGSQLVVVLKGGTQTYREGGEETSVTYEDGDVFWVEPTEAHDHGVTSESPLAAILITIK